jgi:2',3'-cyclic-nucleotide 2'-phosphodiesterase/3'-nucleotidase
MIRAALLTLALLLGATVAPAQTLKLRLLQTTDLHMHLLAWDYYQDRAVEEYGFERTVTLIRAARAEASNSLLFDNGDLLQGNPLGDYVARVQPAAEAGVHPAIRVMNAIGYDAANIGNHEFNYGLPFLRRALAGAEFPVLSANVVEGERADASARPAFTPWTMLERRMRDDTGREHTLRVGVIGFVPPQIMQWDRQHLLGRVATLDIPSRAREFVPQMRAAGADLVVAIAHSGFERGESTPLFAENTVARLAEVPGVDAILFGHSHGEFPGRSFVSHPKVDLDRGTINGVPAVMPGAWGSHLGVIDLVLERRDGRWAVAERQATLRPVYDRAARRSLAAPDPLVAALIRREHEGTLAYLRTEVAHSSAPLHSFFAQVRDDPSVQIVADAQLAWARQALAGTPHAELPLLSAAAPFKTGGRAGWHAYTQIAAGPVAVRSVADLYVFPNTIQILRLTGAQVREWLEMSAGAFNRIDPAGAPEQMLLNPAFPSFNFDTLDGLDYEIDVTQPARYDRNGRLLAAEARRIVGLRWRGRPLADDQVFAVVSNNYRAAGGGSFPGIDGRQVIVDGPDENRAALLQHLRTLGRVEPRADANWRIRPVPGVKLRFRSGAGGIAQLGGAPEVRLVRDIGDGSALFELAP